MSLRDSLQTWRRLAGIGKRPATGHYHAEIVKIFDRHWPDPETPVENITPEQIAVFLERIAHYSAPRFNAILGALKKCVPHCPPIRRRSSPPKLVTLPTQAEFAALLAELDANHRGNAGLSIRFLALTGLRIKEARALKWSDIHADKILVPPHITKNGRPRAVPMVAGLADTLARLRAVPPDRATILPHASMKKALELAAARSGLPRMNHHDMRRLYATRCIESGVDIPTAARWLGHQDGGALLAKTYFHLIDQHSATMAARVAVIQSPSSDQPTAPAPAGAGFPNT